MEALNADGKMTKRQKDIAMLVVEAKLLAFDFADSQLEQGQDVDAMVVVMQMATQFMRMAHPDLKSRRLLDMQMEAEAYAATDKIRDLDVASVA